MKTFFKIRSVLAVLLLCQPIYADDLLSGSTVFLEIEGKNELDKTVKYYGSGVSVLPGYIITNRHVFPGDQFEGKTVFGTFNSGEYDAYRVQLKLSFQHPDRDLVLLKYPLNGRKPECLPLASDSKLKTLDSVLASGFPLGHKLAKLNSATPRLTVSTGKVASIQKNGLGMNYWLDCDMTVNRGSSGGAIVNSDRELVAVTALMSGGFSRGIPIEYVKEFIGMHAFEVDVNRKTIRKHVEEFDIIVRPLDLAGTAKKVVLRFGDQDKRIQLRNSGGSYKCNFRIRNAEEAGKEFYLLLELENKDGYKFSQTVRITKTNPTQEFALRISRLEVNGKKPSGFAWDAVGKPDLRFEVFINGKRETKSVLYSDRLIAFPNTSITASSRDRIRIVVYDKDLKYDDLIGSIEFTVDAETNEIKRSDGIKAMHLQIVAIPARYAW